MSKFNQKFSQVATVRGVAHVWDSHGGLINKKNYMYLAYLLSFALIALSSHWFVKVMLSAAFKNWRRRVK